MEVMMRLALRDINQLIDDVVWPQYGLSYDPSIDKRHIALHEVLCELPEDDYQSLVSLIDEFNWFIPHTDLWGTVRPFIASSAEEGYTRHSKVLYLSPTLENFTIEQTKAVVAHELAHLLLGHSVFPKSISDSEEGEDEAWELVRKWGYEKEVKEHDELLKSN